MQSSHRRGEAGDKEGCSEKVHLSEDMKRGSPPWQYLKEDHSTMKEQQVQSPCGGGGGGVRDKLPKKSKEATLP